MDSVSRIIERMASDSGVLDSLAAKSVRNRTGSLAQRADSAASPNVERKAVRIGFKDSAETDFIPDASARHESDADPDAEVPVEFSEIELASRFVVENGRIWRYCASMGQWLRWDGNVWVFDDTLRAYDLAREICRSASRELQQQLLDLDPKHDIIKAQRGASCIAQASSVAAVEKLARADRVHAIRVSELDSDPWTLNTKSGLIDLRTAILRPSDPMAYCTKITGAVLGSRCDAWWKFLEDVTCGDVAMMGYLQRVAGYFLTGDTSEHALFFAHGAGGNGKSVFVNTVAAVMGDYAVTASMDTFVVSGSDKHPTDLAMLRGARLAVAVETEEGRRWAESKVKAMTGGDAISARFMRQDFFTFKPQFKLLVVGNHKPAIRNVDDAMRRRMHLIPFTFKPTNPDTQLTAKLEAEHGGILGWMLDGLAMLRRAGLNPPETVKRATAEYFAAEDAVGRWLAECVEQDDRHREVVGTGTLFESWRKWADAACEYVGNMKRFSENLSQRGFPPGRHPRSRQTGFTGLRLSAST